MTFSSVTGGRPCRGGERFGAQVVQILDAPEQRSARIRMRKRAAQGATTEMGRMGAEDPRSRAGSTSLTQGLQRDRQRLLGRGRGLPVDRLDAGASLLGREPKISQCR